MELPGPEPGIVEVICWIFAIVGIGAGILLILLSIST
jgi:hypothetical protein